ncbi:hypothetical protein BCR44DRAFT_1442619, partial [Catenaria anguillulae PL171]
MTSTPYIRKVQQSLHAWMVVARQRVQCSTHMCKHVFLRWSASDIVDDNHALESIASTMYSQAPAALHQIRGVQIPLCFHTSPSAVPHLPSLHHLTTGLNTPVHHVSSLPTITRPCALEPRLLGSSDPFPTVTIAKGDLLPWDPSTLLSLSDRLSITGCLTKYSSHSTATSHA